MGCPAFIEHYAVFTVRAAKCKGKHFSTPWENLHNSRKFVPGLSQQQARSEKILRHETSNPRAEPGHQEDPQRQFLEQMDQMVPWAALVNEKQR